MKRGTYKALVLAVISAVMGFEATAASRATQSLRDELRAQSFPQVKVRTAPARVRVASPEDAVVATENMTDLEVPLKSEDGGSINVVSAQPVSQTVEIQALTQPTTLVEDAPVVDSRADRMRKRRQILEEQTEQKMVERLEAERVKAEEARAEKILKSLEASESAPARASGLDSMSSETSQTIQTVVTPTATISAVESSAAISQPTVISTAPTVISTTDISKSEGSSEISLDSAEEVSSTEKAQYFFGVAGGISEYPSLDYVKGVYALGVTGGVRLSDGFIFEGTFLYSSFDLVNQYTLVPGANGMIQMDQMNFLVNLKYQLLKESRIRPHIGVAAAYVYRDFTESNYFQRFQTRKSQALDAGVNGGFDVVISNNFSVGLDLRYMFNVTNRSDFTNNLLTNPSLQINALESYSYYTAGLIGKFTF